LCCLRFCSLLFFGFLGPTEGGFSLHLSLGHYDITAIKVRLKINFQNNKQDKNKKRRGEKERDIGSDDNNINFEAFICANKFNVRGERKREPDGIASEEKQQITGRKIHDNAQQ